MRSWSHSVSSTPHSHPRQPRPKRITAHLFLFLFLFLFPSSFFSNQPDVLLPNYGRDFDASFPSPRLCLTRIRSDAYQGRMSGEAVRPNTGGTMPLRGRCEP